MQSPHVRARGRLSLRRSRTILSELPFEVPLFGCTLSRVCGPPHSAIAWRNFSVARVTWKRRNRRPDTARVSIYWILPDSFKPLAPYGFGRNSLERRRESNSRSQLGKQMFTPLGWREQLVPEMVSWSLRTLDFCRSVTGRLRRVRGLVRRRTPSCSPLISRSRPRSLVPTARISGFITSPTSFRRRSRCLPPLVQGPAGSKSAPP